MDQDHTITGLTLGPERERFWRDIRYQVPSEKGKLQRLNDLTLRGHYEYNISREFFNCHVRSFGLDNFNLDGETSFPAGLEKIQVKNDTLGSAGQTMYTSLISYPAKNYISGGSLRIKSLQLKKLPFGRWGSRDHFARHSTKISIPAKNRCVEEHWECCCHIGQTSGTWTNRDASSWPQDVELDQQSFDGYLGSKE